MSVKVIVNRHVVEANARLGRSDPPLSIVRPGKRVQRAHQIRLKGDATLIYRPQAPLKNGARVWIEAQDAEVVHPLPIAAVY